jgi:transcriptional regulator with XRE-family HTH domain
MTLSPVEQLAEFVKDRRRAAGLTQKELSKECGRPREWVSHLERADELQAPPTGGDVVKLVRGLDLSEADADELGRLVEAAADARSTTVRPRRRQLGRGVRVEVVEGEWEVEDAIITILEEEPEDATIRNTGLKGWSTYLRASASWQRYRELLGEHLCRNERAVFKRVEYLVRPEQLQLAKDADSRLAGDRPLPEVVNAKVKFLSHNPMTLHAMVGEDAAVLALPEASGRAGSSLALVIRDRQLVEALRVWFDEVLWENAPRSVSVSFDRFDESFDEVGKMYGFGGS